MFGTPPQRPHSAAALRSDHAVGDRRRVAEAVVRDRDRLLVQERQQLDATRRGHRVRPHRDVRGAAERVGERRRTAAEQADARRPTPSFATRASHAASPSRTTRTSRAASSRRTPFGSSTAVDTVSGAFASRPAAMTRSPSASVAALADAERHRQRAVAEQVALDADARDVLHRRRTPRPRRPRRRAPSGAAPRRPRSRGPAATPR